MSADGRHCREVLSSYFVRADDIRQRGSSNRGMVFFDAGISDARGSSKQGWCFLMRADAIRSHVAPRTRGMVFFHAGGSISGARGSSNKRDGVFSCVRMISAPTRALEAKSNITICSQTPNLRLFLHRRIFLTICLTDINALFGNKRSDRPAGSAELSQHGAPEIVDTQFAAHYDHMGLDQYCIMPDHVHDCFH